ncbi:hypothetical protein [Burkholderia diffusa]|uniref:hypothetical protein n=1 Tax=Burkholderia diffusa TaxID=488732 RepID=UPI0009C0A3C4|nr:hypothetical protein [Burkholderia diffusa]
MRYLVGLTALCLLAGCAGSPPKPPMCEGEFRPVNIEQQHTSAALNHEKSVALCKGESHVRQG